MLLSSIQCKGPIFSKKITLLLPRVIIASNIPIVLVSVSIMVRSLERFSYFIFLHSWWKSNQTYLIGVSYKKIENLLFIFLFSYFGDFFDNTLEFSTKDLLGSFLINKVDYDLVSIFLWDHLEMLSGDGDILGIQIDVSLGLPFKIGLLLP